MLPFGQAFFWNVWRAPPQYNVPNKICKSQCHNQQVWLDLLRTSTMQTLSQVLACHFVSSRYLSNLCWNGRGLPNTRLRVPRCARGNKRHIVFYGLVSYTSTRLCSYWQDPKLFDDMTESPSPIGVAAASSASISALDNFADNEATQADSSKEAVSKQRLGALRVIKVT